MDVPKTQGRCAAVVGRHAEWQDARTAGSWRHRVKVARRAGKRRVLRAAVDRGRLVRRGAAVAVIAATASCASLGTSLAATPGAVPLAGIRIVGTPTLYVQAPPGSGYKSAWVTFRTTPHLHVALQLVTEVRGLLGRSFGVPGPANCIRSTIINAVGIVKPGSRYKVRIYGRAGQYGKATILLGTFTLAAHAFASTPRSTTAPICA
jgi:hypothetical protein